jgi:catechol-2,3-dioxygenase
MDGFLKPFFGSEHVQSGEDGLLMLQKCIFRHPKSNALSEGQVVEKRLGEVALRVHDLDGMTEFYHAVVQLTLLRKDDGKMAFLKIADGHKGHTSILALFKRRDGEIAEGGPFDHIAFSIDIADFEATRLRLEALGVPVRVSQHNWVQWRSMYINDPEGNEVEFVAFDPSIEQNFDS